jgi:hypothetical protein
MGAECSMKLTEVQQLHITGTLEGRKAFSSPAAKLLSPDAAKELVLRNCDANDPEIKFMLECIERLRESSG